ncbi:MAG: hypothetical protein ABEJ43_10395 [Haloferacaceae archaeon]
MLLVCGLAGGTGVTGTLYEPDEDPPSYRGAPDATAPYVWVCDSFYAVESGGQPLHLDDGVVRVAFERPSPRGFTSRSAALAGAKAHIREQFARIDVTEETEFVVRTPDQ